MPGVKLQLKPREGSHCFIGSVLEILRWHMGAVCGRLIECLSRIERIIQVIERFENPIADCRIKTVSHVRASPLPFPVIADHQPVASARRHGLPYSEMIRFLTSA